MYANGKAVVTLCVAMIFVGSTPTMLTKFKDIMSKSFKEYLVETGYDASVKGADWYTQQKPSRWGQLKSFYPIYLEDNGTKTQMVPDSAGYATYKEANNFINKSRYYNPKYKDVDPERFKVIIRYGKTDVADTIKYDPTLK